ncbi:MAG: ComF family protein [Burkholderiaceae bacterium]|nr:ComF family protein [Burkholderiaceae bacterium]
MAAPCPGLCVLCRAWGRRSLCEPCLQRFAPLLPRCAACARAMPAPVLRCGACSLQFSAFQRCLTGTDYAAPWDRLIAGFKFHQKTELAAALCELVLRSAAVGGADVARPALLLPVPLSRERLRERGYNQAWELARRLARRLGLAARADVLQRSRDTAHQIGMSRAEREHNLRDAFWIEPSQRGRLQGAHVAVIDDVLTTGATAHAAALTLTRGGAARVDVWVAARTP